MADMLEWLDYVEYYPFKGEEGYDGVHDGGVKGLRDDAPADVVRQYKEYERALKNGVIF